MIMPGSIEIILGPKGSGKVKALYAEAKLAKEKGLKVILMAPDLGPLELLKHPDKPRHNIMHIHPECHYRMVTAYQTAVEFDVICIAGGNFLHEIEPMARGLASRGKRVLISAWNGVTHNNGEWELPESMVDILPMASSVQLLTAKCFGQIPPCTNPAVFTARKVMAPMCGILNPEHWTTLCYDHHVKYLETEARLVRTPLQLVPHDSERLYWQREQSATAADLKYWKDFHDQYCSEPKEKPTCAPADRSQHRRARSLSPSIAAPLAIFCLLISLNSRRSHLQ